MEVLAVYDGDRGAVGFKMEGVGGDQSKMRVVQQVSKGLPMSIRAKDTSHASRPSCYATRRSSDQCWGCNRTGEGCWRCRRSSQNSSYNNKFSVTNNE